MATKRSQFLTKSFSAYLHREVSEDDKELTRCGPGTPAGEYLRRFWHPVSYSQQLKDLPLKVRVMGEDLVLFRDKSGSVGMLELHCSHRGTSLEYGKTEEHGIRCCYHGWLFDVDGRILETPLEPTDSTLKDRLCHGAYPVTEDKGLVFAYMGPPDKMPELPVLDLLELPGYKLECGELGGVGNPKPCNWLQLVDNFVDPLHEIVLHGTASGVQLTDLHGQLLKEITISGEADFIKSPTGIIGLVSRRIADDTVWVRNIEYISPNISMFGFPPLFPVEFGPDDTEIHNIPSTIFWAVPIDDTKSIEFSLVLTHEGQANPRTTEPNPVVISNVGGRTYEEMQRMPGDYEAQIGQRPIARHALEHLAASDRGVTMMRKNLRDAIREMQNGKEPMDLVREPGEVIPTYGGDTVLQIRRAPSEEQDKELMRRVALEMAYRYLKDPPNLPTPLQ